MAISQDDIDAAKLKALSVPERIKTSTAEVWNRSAADILAIEEQFAADSAKSTKTHGFVITKARHVRGDS